MDNKQNPEVIIFHGPELDPVEVLTPPMGNYPDGKEKRRLRREKEREKRKSGKR